MMHVAKSIMANYLAIQYPMSRALNLFAKKKKKKKKKMLYL